MNFNNMEGKGPTPVQLSPEEQAVLDRNLAGQEAQRLLGFKKDFLKKYPAAEKLAQGLSTESLALLEGYMKNPHIVPSQKYLAGKVSPAEKDAIAAWKKTQN